jgi:ribose transport system substrate-binding protein
VDGPAEWNVNLQLPIVQAMIAKKPDALIFDPNDDTASAAPVKEAERFGIKAVLVDNAIQGVTAPFLGMDDVQADEVAGRELARMMQFFVD